jgi:hypothetical protein
MYSKQIRDNESRDGDPGSVVGQLCGNSTVKFLPSARESWSLLLVGAFGDVVTTHVGLTIGASEANPATATAVTGAGFGELVILKTMMVLAIAVLWAWAGEIDGPREVIPASIGILWIAVALWNLAVIVEVAA